MTIRLFSSFILVRATADEQEFPTQLFIPSQVSILINSYGGPEQTPSNFWADINKVLDLNCYHWTNFDVKSA